MLVKDIQRRGYQITAGDVGHPFVIAALMQYGQNHIIDQMTRITDKPGYGYQVACGATTLTEEWDGPDPQRPHGFPEPSDAWLCRRMVLRRPGRDPGSAGTKSL